MLTATLIPLGAILIGFGIAGLVNYLDPLTRSESLLARMKRYIDHV